MTERSQFAENQCNRIISESSKNASLNSIIKMIYLFSDLRLAEISGKDTLQTSMKNQPDNLTLKKPETQSQHEEEEKKSKSSYKSKVPLDFNKVCNECYQDSDGEKFFDYKSDALFAPIEIVPKLKDSNYFIFPQIEVIARMTKDQLREVHRFTVGNYYGYIQFLSPVNLAGVAIDDCIQISHLSVTVTSPFDFVRARVVFYDISLTHLTDEKSIDENVKIVIKVLRKMYKIEKSKYDKKSHSFWFITDSLKISKK